MRRKSPFFRLAAVLSLFGLAIQSFALPVSVSLAYLSKIRAQLQGQVTQVAGPEAFDGDPVAPNLGANPGRDPVHRGGLWTDAAIDDMNQTIPPDAVASTAAAQLPVHYLSWFGASGAPQPWEGKDRTHCGVLNTNNGNMLLSFPLFGWKQRGGMNCGLTLNYNSQSNYAGELGNSWTISCFSWINVATSTATVVYGDYTAIPFTKQSSTTGTTGTTTGHSGGSLYSCSGTVYLPPVGIHSSLVQNTDGTWTLTEHDQTVKTFNSGGYLTSITDRNGNTISITLNANDYVTRVTDATGRHFDFTLNGAQEYTAVTDPTGRTWQFAYDANNNLNKITWPTLGGTVYTDQFVYNPTTNKMTSHTDRNGKIWSFGYSGNNLVSETDPLSNVTGYSYTSTSETTTSALAKTRTDNYSSGLLASHVDEAGYSNSFTWSSGNDLLSKTDELGLVWSQTWDSNGNCLTQTNPNSKVWTYTYNSTNDKLTSTDPLSHQTQWGYDTHGNCTSVKDPLLHTTTLGYDAYGELTSKTTPLGFATAMAYSANGDLTSVTDPLSHVTSMAYDSLGRLTSTTDACSNVESVSYDTWGRPTVYTHPDSTTLQKGYDPVGNVTSVTDENGHTSYSTYNSAGWLTEFVNGNGDTENYGLYGLNCLQGSIRRHRVEDTVTCSAPNALETASRRVSLPTRS